MFSVGIGVELESKLVEKMFPNVFVLYGVLVLRIV